MKIFILALIIFSMIKINYSHNFFYYASDKTIPLKKEKNTIVIKTTDELDHKNLNKAPP